MDDVDVGVDRLQESIEERREDHHETAQHAAHKDGAGEHRPRWLDFLAISTALFAVIAAVAALEAGNYANEALFKSNRAALLQTQAADTWSQYQAEGIKKYQALSLVTLLGHVGGSGGEIQAARADAARRQVQQNQLALQARRLSEETDALTRESEAQLEHHHRFAIAVTMLQVAIGLGAIAALLTMRVVWYTSLGIGAIALLAFIDGFTRTI